MKRCAISNSCLHKTLSKHLLAALLLITPIALIPLAGNAQCREPIPGEYIVSTSPLARIALAHASSSQALSYSIHSPFKSSELKDLAFLHLNSSQDSTTAMNAIKALPGIMDVTENCRVHAAALPNDSHFDREWGLHNTGQEGGTPDVDVDAPEAWDITTGNPEMVVAVMDNGVDYTHPDLVSKMWINPGEVAGNGVDDDQNGVIDDIYGYNVSDDNGDPINDPIPANPQDITEELFGRGHGTHVAGTIAASTNNAAGVAGVAPSVKILSLKVLGGADGGGSFETILRGLDYIAVMRNRGIPIAVINASLGGESACPAPLERALFSMFAKGVIFVAAAGNGGEDNVGDNNDSRPVAPANCTAPNVISVANLTRNGILSDSSNFGRRSVDLGAPGSEIWSTYPNSLVARMSGTSMAAPHVSGVAALVMSVNPTLNPYEVKMRLMQTVKPLQALDSTMVAPGIVSAQRALNDQRTFDLDVALKGGTVSARLSKRKIRVDSKIVLHDASSRTSKMLLVVKGGKKPIAVKMKAKLDANGDRSFSMSYTMTAADTKKAKGKIVAVANWTLNDGTYFETNPITLRVKKK